MGSSLQYEADKVLNALGESGYPTRLPRWVRGIDSSGFNDFASYDAALLDVQFIQMWVGASPYPPFTSP